MIPTTRRCFSFRFTRTGQTNLWSLDAETRYGVPADSPEDADETRLAEHNQKIEWIDSIVSITDSDDLEEHYERARRRAAQEFRRRHPEADLIE